MHKSVVDSRYIRIILASNKEHRAVLIVFLIVLYCVGFLQACMLLSSSNGICDGSHCDDNLYSPNYTIFPMDLQRQARKIS